MLDLRRIRYEPDAIRAGLSRRGADVSLVDRVLELDERARAVGAEVDELRNQVKVVSKEIGELFKACLLYTSPSPRDKRQSRMPSSA